MVVMALLQEVREEGHCNVVGGPTGSGTCATALSTSELPSPQRQKLTRCELSGSHFLHCCARRRFRSPLIGTKFALPLVAALSITA